MTDQPVTHISGLNDNLWTYRIEYTQKIDNEDHPNYETRVILVNAFSAFRAIEFALDQLRFNIDIDGSNFNDVFKTICVTREENFVTLAIVEETGEEKRELNDLSETEEDEEDEEESD